MALIFPIVSRYRISSFPIPKNIVFAPVTSLYAYVRILFPQRSDFSTPARGLLSIVTYTTGGFDYSGLFHLGQTAEDNQLEEIHFPVVSCILWIVFIIIMPILLNNLLVGILFFVIAIFSIVYLRNLEWLMQCAYFNVFVVTISTIFFVH